MLHYPLRTRFVIGCLMCLAPGSIFIGHSKAAKPGSGGGGGTPAGRIYYSHSGGVSSMNADGTAKQLTPYEEGPRTEFLSYRLHGGHRWYLEIRWSAETPWEHSLFAVRDDGDPDSSVLLLTAADVGDHVYWFDAVRWGQDDSFISLMTMPQVVLPDGSLSDDSDALHTISVVEIVFDASGRPMPATPPVAVVAGVLPGQKDLSYYDHSPDGTGIVYVLGTPPGSGRTELRIADLLTGQSRQLAADALEPAWSPDGSRIAFRYLYETGLFRIGPDGGGKLRLTNSGFAPVWSPDGKYLAYSGSSSSKNPVYDVYRIPENGGSAVNLTKDISGDAGVHPGFGWR